jgi:hypothetical protein
MPGPVVSQGRGIRVNRAQGAISDGPAAFAYWIGCRAQCRAAVELSHPVVEAGIYDAPAGTALGSANFTQPIEALTVRVPLAKPIQAVLSGGGLFSVSRAGHASVAMFTTRLGLNDIFLLE